MKSIFAFLLLTFSLSALAQQDFFNSLEEAGIVDSEGKYNYETDKYVPQNDPFIGLPMRYPVYVNEPRAYPAGGGLATFNNLGQPIVLISMIKAQEVGPLVMGAILQHEYCHFDTDITYPISAVREARADCCAAANLARANRPDAANAFANYMGAGGCSYNPNIPIEQVPASHPCGTQRYAIIKQCYQQAAAN